MRRAVVGLAVIGILLGGVAPVLADTVNDAQRRFEISWPAGWTTGSDPALVEGFPPPGAPPGVNCLAEVRQEPGIAAMTQEQINQELLLTLNDADWLALSGSPELKSFTEKLVIEGPLVSQRATAVITMPDLKVIKARLALFVRPGEVYVAACLAFQPDFAGVKEQFEAILASFRPL